MEAAMRAIAEPRRREILRLVWDAELPAGQIAKHFDHEVTRPAISQHLRVLRDAGLVEERREGTRRLYRAQQERVEELRKLIDSFWERGLSSLKEAAEREQRARARRRRPSTGRRKGAR
jgi:DNA-binding transcriptional ArsR family regulator